MASAHTHISAGLLLGVAVGGALHLDAAAMALFAASSGGAALLADADTPNSAIYNAGGLISKVPLWFLRKSVEDKHRGPTHSPFFLGLVVAAVSLLGWFPGHLPIHWFASHDEWLPVGWPDRIALPVVLSVLFTRTTLTLGTPMNFRPLISKHHRRFIMLIVAVVVAYCGYVLSAAPHFSLGMTLAVGAGYASHLLTDWPTERGIPLAWPFSRRRYALAHIKVYGFIDYFAGLLFFGFAVWLYIKTAHGGGVPVSSTVSHVVHAIARHK